MANEQHIDSVIAEYLAECDELTQRVSNHLRLVEKNQWTADTIDSIYRDIHTIKGSAMLFGYSVIGDIGHAMETTLDPVRRLQKAPKAAHLEALFQCLDAIEQGSAAIRTGQEAALAPLAVAVIKKLNESCAEAEKASPGASAAPLLASVPPAISEIELAPESAPLNTAEALQSLLDRTAAATSAATAPKAAAAPALALAPGALAAKPAPLVATPPTPAPPPLQAPEAPKSVSPPQAPVAAAPAPATGAHGSGDAESSSSIRVPVALLDKLMILMGEMVLVRNQVLQYANRTDDLEFLNLSQRLNVVTSEIQGEVMKTRMQPIGNVVGKFHRVVRDLSRDLGKKIELQLTGMDTELDKTLLEAVKDPIMHIVRNSCDHGLEKPEERKSGGKPETGTIAVRSFHEGGQVIVEISDDGRGLHREKITAKAIEKGILTPERAAAMSDREAQALIFAPGFSTAAAVTNVSGRGVGMDVVKSNIEGIGGVVDLTSRPDKGTTIRLKIPLTLAIVPTMIIRCRGERFAIPQGKLVELVRVEKNVGGGQIEMLEGMPVYRLRGRLLPLLTLEQILGMPKLEARPADDISTIAVLNAEGKLFGLIVDEVQDTAEVVVKPLSSFLKSLPLYSGATVLGDGSVALILDVMGIAQQQGLMVETAQHLDRADAEANKVNSEMQEFLLFRVGSPTKHAIPLNLVHRLEEFSRAQLEISGKQRVIRYRNSVLPIVSLNESLGLDSNAAGTDSLNVIVIRKAGRFYGIEVDEILDVLTTSENMDDGITDRGGLLGNLVTPEGLVVIVDALFILDSFAKKNQAATGAPAPEVIVSAIRKILFVEDTAFFRKHVSAVLVRAGFAVTTAIDGQAALELLEASPAGTFDLVLSDIEMPRMNGIELVGHVRKNAVWCQVPMLALTTKFDAQHAEDGRRAGFDAYLEKLNPEILMKAIEDVSRTKRVQRSA